MFAQPARPRHVPERRPSRDGWRAEQPELLVEAVLSRPDAQQGFDEADFCVLAAQSATFVNAPAGCAAATKDQGGRGDCLFRPAPSGGLRRVASCL